MSSILKALKKLEQEKAARRPDSFRIDAEILRGGGQQRSFFSKGASLAAIALFLCGVGATYLFMKHNQASAPVLQSQASKSGVKGESSFAAPLSPASTLPVAEPQSGPPAKGIPASGKSEPAQRSVVQQQPAQLKSTEIVPHAVPPGPEPVSPPVPGVPLVPPARPVLKVDGIAFQDGADSVAVINGVTVSNGSVIEGARVEEIQKDRVRFSRGGERFEIVLDKSN